MEQEPLTRSQQQSEAQSIGSGSRLTIDTIVDFIQRLRQGLNETETLLIEFEPGVEMDITALQALCSAYTTALDQGKRFVRQGPAPNALIDLAAAAGIQCRERCIKHNEPCFFS